MTGADTAGERAWRSAASVLLPGADPAPVALDASEGAALVERAAQEGLTGALVHAVEVGQGELAPDSLERLQARHEDAMGWCLTLEARLVEVGRWFAEAGGVEHLVVKGPAGMGIRDVPKVVRRRAGTKRRAIGQGDAGGRAGTSIMGSYAGPTGDQGAK